MLELIILTSVFTQGLFIVGQDPYILAPFRQWLAAKLGGVAMYNDNELYFEFDNWICELWKPIWGCPTCMASIWGIISYSIFYEYSINTLWILPLFIISVSCLNFIIFNNLIKKYLF